MPGGYIDFINSMLNLRGQRLQEERYEQLERMETQQQMMNMVGDIGQSITKYGQRSSENAMANRLWQEYRGGGAAASTPGASTYGNVPQDASFGGAKLAAGGETPFGAPSVPSSAAPAPITGGIPELKLRLGMEELGTDRLKEELSRKNERERLDISQGHLTLAAGREGRTAASTEERDLRAAEGLELRRQAAARADEVARLKAEQKVVDDAMTSFKAADPKFQAQAKNAEAYNKGVTASLQAMSGPYATQESYLQGLQKIDALYAGAESQGLKVDKPKIATWEDMEAARQKQLAIDAATRGDWNPFTDDAAKAAALQKELQGMPGYTQHPARVNPENFIARPSMERPEPPDIEALRAQAAPAQAATAAAPGVTVGPGATSQASMSASEYKARTGKDVAPGTVVEDNKKRRLLITP